MHVFSGYHLNETSNALEVQCRPFIDIHVILVAGYETGSNFVESVITSTCWKNMKTETMVSDWVSVPATSTEYFM